LVAKRLGGDLADRIWIARSRQVFFTDRQLSLLNCTINIRTADIQEAAREPGALERPEQIPLPSKFTA
jgi:hypothetical protein